MMKKILLLSLLLIHLFASPAAFSANKIAQLDFRDITVSDALKILSDQSSLNIVASQQAAQVHITMYLQNIRPLDVIDAIAKTYNLWYKHDKKVNIIRLYTVQEYRMEQVEFKQEKTKIYTLKNAKNALDLADTISNLYGRRVRLSFGENQHQLVDDLYDRFERFDLIDSRTRQDTSNSNNSGNSSSNSGNSSNNSSNSNSSSNNSNSNNSSNSRNSQNNNQNQNIAIDEGFNNFSESLSKNKAQQNLLAGNANSMNNAILHQSPIYVSVIKRQNRVLIRTRDAEALDNINYLSQQLDTESSMMMLEVKILSLDLGDDFNSLFDFKIKDVGDFAVTGGQNATAVVADTLISAASAFNPTLLATLVSDKFEARLQLLEKENRVTELATPVLMITNQEVSRIFIGEERPIITSYESSQNTTTNTVAGNAVIVNSSILPVTEIRNLGTTLLLTPNINADRTVSIRILIEQSGLSPRQATIPIPLGNGLVDAKIDVVQSKTFSGTVIAKDNTAIAVGGLIEEKASDRESKVPFLGDIPLLGFFFREDAKARGRQELVVIIRPHIIATPTEASQFNQKFMRGYSKHPNAVDSGNLNIYSNPTGEHKDYKLEKKFKEYPGQDIFDWLDDDENWE